MAFYLVTPPPSVHRLENFFDDYDPEYSPMRLRLGRNEVILVLLNNDPLRATFQAVEKRSLDTPSFVDVLPSPTHGYGVFATKDIQPGELLFSERPLVSAIKFCDMET
jgi:hypothetical protein